MTQAGYVTRPALATATAFSFSWTHCRKSERVLIAFFIYTAGFCFFRNVDIVHKLFAVLIPLTIFGAACLEACKGSRLTRTLRDWIFPALVLGGYWQMQWFASPPDTHLQHLWRGWDRLLLDGWGLRLLIESLGRALPWCLELSYLLLYVIPPACLAVLYWQRTYVNVNRFLLTFALGTLIVYALLPLIAVQSPRLAFAGQDLPAAHSLWRSMNLWILNHMDISTSVFPSGHVAVAFSSAFGIRRALPSKPLTFLAFLGMALAVFIATIYGRYHYAVDGVASIVVCLAVWIGCEAYEPLG